MNKDEVLRLATLARIEMGDAEAESLSHEFDAILKYVSDVKGSTSPQPLPLARGGAEGRGVFNILREDANPHESGLYTKQILEQAPQREGEYIKVKKIL